MHKERNRVQQAIDSVLGSKSSPVLREAGCGSLSHVVLPQDVHIVGIDLDRALRNGGIIILSAPNPLSSNGIVTKSTPHWLCVWFYRNVRGWKEAGLNGLAVWYGSAFGYGDSRDVIGRKSKSVDVVMKIINLFFRVVSLGTLKPELSQYHFVLQKPSHGSAAEGDTCGV